MNVIFETATRRKEHRIKKNSKIQVWETFGGKLGTFFKMVVNFAFVTR